MSWTLAHETVAWFLQDKFQEPGALLNNLKPTGLKGKLRWRSSPRCGGRRRRIGSRNCKWVKHTWDTRYIITHGISRPSKQCQQFFALARKFNTEKWFSQRTLSFCDAGRHLYSKLYCTQEIRTNERPQKTKRTPILLCDIDRLQATGWVKVRSCCISVRHCFHRLRPLLILVWKTCRWRWVWSNGGMILTGENWSTGRKTLYSVGGRWMNGYGAMVEWYWQGKLKYWEKNIIQRGW